MTEETADNGSRPGRPPRSELPLAEAARHLAEKAAAARARAAESGGSSPAAPPRGSSGAVAPPPVAATPAPVTAPIYPPPTAAGPLLAQYAVTTEPAYARWWKRACAALLDGLLLSIPNGAIVAILGGNRLQTDPITGEVTARITGGLVAAWIITFVLSLVYYVVFEGGSKGQTPGKMAMNLTVRDESTLEPIGYPRALGRRLLGNVFWVLLIVPGILDVLAPLWSRRRQTWHDNIVGSVVVDSA